MQETWEPVIRLCHPHSIDYFQIRTTNPLRSNYLLQDGLRLLTELCQDQSRYLVEPLGVGLKTRLGGQEGIIDREELELWPRTDLSEWVV